MVRVIYVYVDTVFGFYVFVFYKLLSWMFHHNCLDTCYFECLICMCFAFWYLHLFSTTEHLSHGKVL